jgi:hypothetical protein
MGRSVTQTECIKDRTLLHHTLLCCQSVPVSVETENTERHPCAVTYRFLSLEPCLSRMAMSIDDVYIPIVAEPLVDLPGEGSESDAEDTAGDGLPAASGALVRKGTHPTKFSSVIERSSAGVANVLDQSQSRFPSTSQPRTITPSVRNAPDDSPQYRVAEQQAEHDPSRARVYLGIRADPVRFAVTSGTVLYVYIKTWLGCLQSHSWLFFCILFECVIHGLRGMCVSWPTNKSTTHRDEPMLYTRFGKT